MAVHSIRTTAAERFVIMIELIQRMAKPFIASLGFQSGRLQEYNELIEQLVADLDRELAPNQVLFTIDPFEVERLLHRMSPARQKKLAEAVSAFEAAAAQTSRSPSGEVVFSDVNNVNLQLANVVKILKRRYL